MIITCRLVRKILIVFLWPISLQAQLPGYLGVGFQDIHIAIRNGDKLAIPVTTVDTVNEKQTQYLGLAIGKGEYLTTSSLIQIQSSYLEKISSKAEGLNERIDGATAKVLKNYQKEQEKILKKLSKIDVLKAEQFAKQSVQSYQDLTNKLNSKKNLVQYIPYLDTLKTSIKFLDKGKGQIESVKGIIDGMDQKIKGASESIAGLESQLQKATEVKQYLQEQQTLLTQHLKDLGFSRQLMNLSKEVYYYKQEINEYKEILNDPGRMERKAIDMLCKTRLFQDFMNKNSALASLFGAPGGNVGEQSNMGSIAGLQTRVQVNQAITSQLGTSCQQAMQQLQSNGQQAQDILKELKNKVNELGGGVNDGDMPDFKPNSQKNKSAFKRIEYGTNIQTQRPNGYFPVTSDIGLSLGYKMNDKSVIGIGASYKMGWGQDIQHIKISHQGAALRSFLDYKLKKTLWVSGGFEMNYLSMINSIEQLKTFDAWQSSGLIGVSKKLPFNSNFFKNTKIQVLWDFLSSYQIPKTQPIIFRIGYSIK